MPSNYTSNYRLNQWEPGDSVLRTDFNADNAKIDAAIKGEADARINAVSALTSLVSSKGNCRVYTTTYTGSGMSGQSSPNRLSFPRRPLIVFVAGTDGSHAVFIPGQTQGYSYNADGVTISVGWSGNTLSWSCHTGAMGQLNSYGETYQAVALMEA